MPRYTRRLETLPEYPLANIPIQKRELIARGIDVIDLGAGDADLSPPEVVLQRLAEASRIPSMSRYGFGLGLMEFRESTPMHWLVGDRHPRPRRPTGSEPTAAVRSVQPELHPLIGSKEGISHLALAFISKGDVSIIPDPGYNAYIGGTVLAEGEPYKFALRPENDFLIELDEIPSDILKRARVLYLNYPNNPTSAIAPKQYLERVVRRCRELDIVLVYDNAYSELAFDGYRPPSIFEIDGARDVAIEFHSMSKTYNMTGWRCGWAVANREICSVLAKVKSFTDTGQFMAVQAAAVAALASHDEFVPRNVAVFQARRDLPGTLRPAFARSS